MDGNLDIYAASPACRPQIFHVNYDVKDTQQLVSGIVDGDYLSADVAVSPKKVGIAGVSLGGGQTWLLTRRNKWKTPKRNIVKLAAAVPVIGPTDLADALAPNGRAHAGTIQTKDVAEREAERVGVPKTSYIGALYSLAQITSADFQVPGYLEAWKQRFDAGEPYDDDITADAIHKLLANRSAYYVPKTGAFNTPTLAIQGFTDHLFNAMQVVRFYEGFVADADNYPFSAYFGDFGHPIAQNKDDETAYIYGLVNRWLDHYLKGKGADPSGVIEGRTTVCGEEAPMGALYRSTTWEGLHETHDSFPLELSGELSTEVADPHASLVDPITEPRNVCRTTDTAVAEGNLAATVELPEGYTMMGFPDVTFDADPSASNLYVAARLWDVDPATNTQTLVDRGVFRLAGEELQSSVALQLFGNGWTFAPGHSLKLELTANDAPAFEEPNQTGTIAISGVSIALSRASGTAAVAP